MLFVELSDFLLKSFLLSVKFVCPCLSFSVNLVLIIIKLSLLSFDLLFINTFDFLDLLLVFRLHFFKIIFEFCSQLFELIITVSKYTFVLYINIFNNLSMTLIFLLEILSVFYGTRIHFIVQFLQFVLEFCLLAF